MQPSTTYSRITTSPLLVLALCAGCAEPTSPDTNGKAATPPAPKMDLLHVALATTGVDLDPDGYVLVVDNSIRQSVKINDTVDIAAPSAPPFVHLLRLDGIAANCVHGFKSDVLDVPKSGSATVTVSCVTRSIPAAFAATQLLFERSGQMYRMRGDGTGLVALGSGSHPVWSPDARHIAFTRDTDIYVMDADGTNARLVAPGFSPAWSPDGNRLAFHANDNAGIMVVPVDGSTAPVRIAEPAAGLAWSPDGSRIALERLTGTEWDTGPVDAIVSVVDPEGSNPETLARFPVNDFAAVGTLAWSPDGNRLALGNGDGVLVMNADGSNLRKIGNTSAHAPVWSPDGQAIAFNTACWNPQWCTFSVLYVTIDGSSSGLLLENGLYVSWHT